MVAVAWKLQAARRRRNEISGVSWWRIASPSPPDHRVIAGLEVSDPLITADLVPLRIQQEGELQMKLEYAACSLLWGSHFFLRSPDCNNWIFYNTWTYIGCERKFKCSYSL